MSPVSRRDNNSPKNKKGEVPVSDQKTPLRIFRNTFKGNKMPMTVVMLVVLLGLVAYLAPSGRSDEAPDNVVARVYGREVLRRDVAQTLSDMARRMGNQGDIKSMLPFLQAQALRRTVDMRLYEELAQRRGLVVTDQEARIGLEARLRQHEVFLQNGQLRTTSEIVSILRENGIALMDWEKEVRDQLLIQKLMEQAAAQTPVDASWVALENRVQNEQITYEFATLTPDIAAVADPGDGTLDAYLKASGARFQYGPRRVLQYVAADQASFGDSLKVEDAALLSAYESKKSQYTELDASHILFRAQSEAEFAEATQKAEELRTKLVAGADFAKTAAAQSQDPTAQANKGRLGWFKTGAMVKSFEDGAMALKVGEVSQPVRTSYGVHLIKLEGRREKSFDEVKEELRAQVMKDRFATRAKDRLEQLRKRVGDKGDLTAAAKTLNLTPVTTLPLLNEPTAVIEGFSEPSAIVSQAFEMKVGEVSKVQQAGDRFVVFRVQEEKPIAVPPLPEIRTKVLSAWKLEEARKKVAEKAKAALEAKSFTAFAVPALKENVTIQSLGSLSQHPALRKALLETPVDAFTPALWTPEGQMWLARIKGRVAAAEPTFEKRMMIIQTIQAGISQELLEAERKDLDAKGRQRGGFSSLWGRFGGVWMNPNVSFTNTNFDLGE